MTQLSVEEALERISLGKQIILVDDEDRENEGDLCMAAAKVRADDINFMARYGRGLICLTMTQARIERLNIPRMADRNTSRFGTNFYVSIEAKHGVTTGISAADRAHTIQVAVDPNSTADSVVTPGHVFPICAREGGVLVRTGQTEGSVDLARLAGFEPAGVICEIMKDDGTMARRVDLEHFAETHHLGILTIAQLIQHRLQREQLIQEVVSAEVAPSGMTRPCRLTLFKSPVANAQYLALVVGNVTCGEPVLVRMHRASIPSDVFSISAITDGKNQQALMRMEHEGAGVFVYVFPDELDLEPQVRSLLNRDTSTEERHDAPPALREFGLGAQVLIALGVKKMRIMTDNPRRIVGLKGYGLEVVGQVPFASNPH